MAGIGLSRGFRGEKGPATTNPKTGAPGGRLNPQFVGERPHPPWGGGFFYVRPTAGVVYVGGFFVVFFGDLGGGGGLIVRGAEHPEGRMFSQQLLPSGGGWVWGGRED
ncbi:hypothetical protein AP220_26275 [Escherichia coli]|nr:hypothetical protein AP220_26275 [Escherichia coli]